MSTEKDVDRSQSQCEPGSHIFINLLIHRINLEEVHARVNQGKEKRHRRKGCNFVFRLARDEGSDGKDRKEQGGEAQGQTKLAAIIKTGIPADVQQYRRDIAEHQ